MRDLKVYVKIAIVFLLVFVVGPSMAQNEPAVIPYQGNSPIRRVGPSIRMIPSSWCSAFIRSPSVERQHGKKCMTVCRSWAGGSACCWEHVCRSATLACLNRQCIWA